MNDVPDEAIEEAMQNIRDEYDDPAVDTLMDAIDIHYLIDRMEGRSGGLRPSKPQAEDDTGLTQYVWRMCRFHSGQDPKMPVTADFWLRAWMDEQNGLDGSYGSDDRKAITDALEHVVTLILLVYGQDPAGGAKRWHKAFHGSYPEST